MTLLTQMTEKRLKLSDDFDLVVMPLPLGRVRISLERFNDPKEWGVELERTETQWLRENLFPERDCFFSKTRELIADVKRLGEETRASPNQSIIDAFNTKYAEMLAETRKAFGLDK